MNSSKYKEIQRTLIAGSLIAFILMTASWLGVFDQPAAEIDQSLSEPLKNEVLPLCDSVVDECGVCGGEGIVEGACDCDGNLLDVCGDCGGGATNKNDCDSPKTEDVPLVNKIINTFSLFWNPCCM